jgi:transcriptional/translational regulatory protein YebC/TACO1
MNQLWEVRRKLEKKGYTVKSADVIDFANTTIQLNKEKMEEFTTLLREINEIPDISDISNNVEPPEEEEEDEE